MAIQNVNAACVGRAVPVAGSAQIIQNLAAATQEHQTALTADRPAATHIERVLQQIVARRAAVLDLAHQVENGLLQAAGSHPASLAAVIRSPAMVGVQRYQSRNERALVMAIGQLQRFQCPPEEAPSVIFGDENECRLHLVRWQQAQPWNCIECKSTDRYWLNSRRQFECPQCGHQYPDSFGTIYVGTHLPLRLWFTIVSMLMICGRVSVSQLTAQFGINRPQTIRIVANKISAALEADDADQQLAGVNLIVWDYLEKVHPSTAMAEPSLVLKINSELSAEADLTKATGTRAQTSHL